MVKIPALICIMNTEEAIALNMKILGSAGTGIFAGKSLVRIQAYLQ